MTDKNSLNHIVKVCFKIIGAQQRDSCSLWEKQVAQKAKGIISQSDHVLSSEFTVMPSGWHYDVPLWRANCSCKSFIPPAIRLLNADNSHFKCILNILFTAACCFLVLAHVCWSVTLTYYYLTCELKSCVYGLCRMQIIFSLNLNFGKHTGNRSKQQAWLCYKGKKSSYQHP